MTASRRDYSLDAPDAMDPRSACRVHLLQQPRPPPDVRPRCHSLSRLRMWVPADHERSGRGRLDPSPTKWTCTRGGCRPGVRRTRSELDAAAETYVKKRTETGLQCMHVHAYGPRRRRLHARRFPAGCAVNSLGMESGGVRLDGRMEALGSEENSRGGRSLAPIQAPTSCM